MDGSGDSLSAPTDHIFLTYGSTQVVNPKKNLYNLCTVGVRAVFGHIFRVLIKKKGQVSSTD